MKKLLFVLTVFLLLFAYGCTTEKSDAAGTITVIIVNYEEEEAFNGDITFTIDDTLLELLKEHKDVKLVVEDSDWGAYITGACGISSDDYPQTFWEIIINDEPSMVGISEIPLKDKDIIKLQLIKYD